jgi:hypothetical protein
MQHKIYPLLCFMSRERSNRQTHVADHFAILAKAGKSVLTALTESQRQSKF